MAVDARPSDAIALALRTRAPILVEQHVIDNAKTVDVAHEQGRRRTAAPVAREPRPRRPRQVPDVICRTMRCRPAAYLRRLADSQGELRAWPTSHGLRRLARSSGLSFWFTSPTGVRRRRIGSRIGRAQARAAIRDASSVSGRPLGLGRRALPRMALDCECRSAIARRGASRRAGSPRRLVDACVGASRPPRLGDLVASRGDTAGRPRRRSWWHCTADALCVATAKAGRRWRASGPVTAIARAARHLVASSWTGPSIAAARPAACREGVRPSTGSRTPVCPLAREPS